METRGTSQGVVESQTAPGPTAGGDLADLVERYASQEGLPPADWLQRHRLSPPLPGVRTQGPYARLLKRTLDLADAIMAPLVSDRLDGLWPTVVVDERGVALGLVYSSRESVREAVRRGQGVYQSRSRGLCIKGETSGAVVTRLGVRALRIGGEIDPGVPWTSAQATAGEMLMALKSGNFGGPDFFLKSFAMLER